MEYDIEKILTMYEDDYNPRSMVPGPRNMANGGSIGKPGGLVEDGVTKYGVTETAYGSYKAEAERRGKRLAETFKNKSEAEAALKKFYKENPFTIIVICIILMLIFFGMMIMIATPSN